MGVVVEEKSNVTVQVLCPNTPPCPHSAFVHDIEDYEDRVPTCCIEGCNCGKKSENGAKDESDKVEKAVCPTG